MDARLSINRTDPAGDRIEGRRVKVGGIVQGVGFRPWVHRLAARERITGRVWNDSTGATIEAFGDPIALERFVELLLTSAPPAARIDNVACEPIAREHLDRFEIAQSRPGAYRRPAIRPIWQPARSALQRFLIRPTAAIATRSPTAPVAARALRLRATSP